MADLKKRHTVSQLFLADHHWTRKWARELSKLLGIGHPLRWGQDSSEIASLLALYKIWTLTDWFILSLTSFSVFETQKSTCSILRYQNIDILFSLPSFYLLFILSFYFLFIGIAWRRAQQITRKIIIIIIIDQSLSFIHKAQLINDFYEHALLFGNIVPFFCTCGPKMLSCIDLSILPIYRMVKKWHNFESLINFKQDCIAISNFATANFNMLSASIWIYNWIWQKIHRNAKCFEKGCAKIQYCSLIGGKLLQ